MNKNPWSCTGITHVGKVRSTNQDAYFVSSDQNLVVVADGIGGGAYGELASAMTAETADELWSGPVPPDQVEAFLLDLVDKSNDKIVTEARARGEAHMGTTVVACILPEKSRLLRIVHVGDSRAYLIRDQVCTVLTQDHSLVMTMFRKGQLTLEQAKNSIYKNLLSRCLGQGDGVEGELTDVDLQPGDWLVLATDGLVLEEEHIAQIIDSCQSPEEACEKLLNATLEAGAPDNVTVVAIKYDGVPASVDAAPVQSEA